ncbi:MAG: undecaprenyl-diphosphatase [Clostridium sp.]|uniref:undecaprenyl-diphosphatase n=1 Tax=Clostridium sp. TaxID=1506 RepID=UPI003EE6B390
MSWNLHLFYLINGLAYKSAVLDWIMIFFTKVVPIIYALILLAVFIIGMRKRDRNIRKVAISTGVFTVINLLVSSIIGKIWFEPRPFVTHQVNLLVPHKADASFPSDHVIGTFSIALGLGWFSKVLRVIMIIGTVFVAFSRVFVGNHYPGDVIGAYIVVIIMSIIYKKLLRKPIERLYLKVDKKIFG